MENINYTEGDATNPVDDGKKIIVHICNDIGGWGKGFVMAISKRWKSPEVSYRQWYDSKDNFELGKVQFVEGEENLIIANLIGQHKTRKSKDGTPPIRYDAVKSGLESVSEKAKALNATVHMPRIGCGLAGGKGEEIEAILEQTLIKNNIKTTVYDFG